MKNENSNRIRTNLARIGSDDKFIDGMVRCVEFVTIEFFPRSQMKSMSIVRHDTLKSIRLTKVQYDRDRDEQLFVLH
jgi:hypothetical protein